MWRIFGHTGTKQQEEGENRPFAMFELVVEGKVFKKVRKARN
jgi:hypothetical protein